MTRINRRKKRNTGIILILIGIVALLSAGGLYLRNTMEENRAAEASDHAAQLLLAKIEENILTGGNNPLEPGVKDHPSTNIPDSEYHIDDAPDDEGVEKIKSPTVAVEGELYIGVLSIPAMRLQWPINSQWSYPRLKHTPCRYSGNAENNTLVVMAHNYRYHFGRFSNLKIGDAVKFTDTLGNEYNYTVEEVETIQPTRVDKVINNRFDLNLFTCNYNGDARIAVKCKRVLEQQ